MLANVYPTLWSSEQLLHQAGASQSLCLCCGFCLLPLESWQLQVCFICSELMKGESVKAKVLEKPFLKPQEAY